MAKRRMGAHYEQLLGLEAPWRVEEVDLALDEGEVRIRVTRSGRAKLRCPHCGGVCPGYDTRERRWRHLDTMQYRTIVSARVPRVECPEHGVVQVAVPWAEEGSRFTALFEALVIDWLLEASFSAVARQLRLSWDQVAGIQDRAVQRGLARRDRKPLRRIGVDETSFQKRHEYVTTVNDLDEGRRGGLTTADRDRITELERENRELRRTNDILRKASAYFAQAELDRRPK